MRKAEWKRDHRSRPCHCPCTDFEPSVCQFAFRMCGYRRESASAGHSVVHFVMVGDRGFPAATILGCVCLLLPPIMTCWSRRQVACIVMPCGMTVHEMADPILPDGYEVAASLPTRCRGSLKFRPCRCGDFGLMSRYRPAGHPFLMLRTSSCIFPCCCGSKVYAPGMRLQA